MKIIFQFIILFFYSCYPSISAEIDVERFQSQNGEQKKVVMRGVIELGDVVRFERAVGRDPSLGKNEYAPNIPRVLDLSGIGGDYNAAIQIANMVHDNAMEVFVPENQICQGPCAIIFMAGRVPSGDDYFDAARCLQKGSIVFFGVPSIAEQLVATATQGQLTRNTRLEVLQSVISFIRMADVHQWPPGLLDAMLDQDGSLSITPESNLFLGEQGSAIKTYKNKGGC